MKCKRKFFNFLKATMFLPLLLSCNLIFAADSAVFDEVGLARENVQDKGVLIEIKKLDENVKALVEKGAYDEAVNLLEKILILKKETFGSKSQEVAETLNALGELYYVKGNYDKSEESLKETLEIKKLVFGDEHENLAEAYANLGILYRVKINLDKAEELLRKSLAIYRKKLGSEDDATLVVINNLASTYLAKADFNQAEVLYKECLKIREKKGIEDIDFAILLNDVGLLNVQKGEYEEGEHFYKRAISISEKHEPTSLYLSQMLQNIGELYYIRGDLKIAEEVYLRSLNIKETYFGANHITIAPLATDLGLLYYTYGDYAKAENFYKKACSLEERLRSPSLATTLYRLGQLYIIQERYDMAETVLKRSVEIYESVIGKQHYTLAVVLAELALVYTKTKNYEKGQALYEQALLISEKQLGKEHVGTATIIYNMALLYADKKDYDQAIALQKKAIDIYERGLFASPILSVFNNKLSEHFQLRGNVDEAIRYKIVANDLREKNIEQYLYIGSENQKIRYLTGIENDVNKTITLHLNVAPKNEQAARMAMECVLRRKGRSLDAMSNIFASLRKHGNEEEKKLFEELLKTKTQIASIVFKDPIELGQEEYLIKAKNLELKAQDLEKRISDKSFYFRNVISKISLDLVQQEIPADSVLIEYVSYQPYDLKTNKYGSRRYVAYILNSETINFVDLGDAEAIDEAVIEFRDTLIKKPINSLSSIKQEVKPKASIINNLLISPIWKIVAGTPHLIIVPDGLLNTVPFEAFVDQEGKYLIEKSQISYLTSGRDLLRLKNRANSEEPPTIIANPSYGDGQGPILAGNQYKALKKLEGTIKEAIEVKKILLSTNIYLEEKATKEALTELNRPEILHIATHGYFLADISIGIDPNSSIETQRSLFKKIEEGNTLSPVSDEELRSSNPLLRSFLFFAGANNNKESGLMTALEASALNLLGTKLVVLSACESGLGDIKTGDGVYGLRRAFTLAGAETQMFSLWAVDDIFTSKLMSIFYKLLSSGEKRSEALRKTQLYFLELDKPLVKENGNERVVNGLSKNRRVTKKSKDEKSTEQSYSHPYYWAGFIQSGEWANLNGKR